MRDRETIDSELRLLAAVRRVCRAQEGIVPDIGPIDELLDERIAAGAIKKAGFTVSGTLREVRHQPKETMLIIGYASIIIPAEYRNSESIIFNRAIR